MLFVFSKSLRFGVSLGFISFFLAVVSFLAVSLDSTFFEFVETKSFLRFLISTLIFLVFFLFSLDSFTSVISV